MMSAQQRRILIMASLIAGALFLNSLTRSALTPLMTYEIVFIDIGSIVGILMLVGFWWMKTRRA